MQEKTSELIQTQKNIDFIKYENVVETYLADTLPNVSICASAYAIIFQNGEILMTELREGERPTRRYDVPGGHVDGEETPEEAVVRETFEETGVRVRVIKLVAYNKVTLLCQKPESWRYPYPESYMAFYLCEVVEETPFEGNEETHGRIWLKKEEYQKSEWCVINGVLLDAVISIK